MKRTTHERAFAKLNLLLDVLGKRPDGYHELDTVMQTVSLWDEVSITLTDTPGIEVDSNRNDLPKGTDNLAGKAGEIFLRRVDITNKGIKIYINKKIPDRAGLAGGSADAAAVVRGLCRLLPEVRLSPEKKLSVCAEIGSDVPFCLVGGTKRAQGRGEVLTDLLPMSDCAVLIVKPAFSVSTPALFRAIDGRALTRRPEAEKMAKALGRGDLEGVCREVGNVFEQVLPPEEQAVVDAVNSALLDSGALAASMTGTGSAVFGLFPGEKDVKIDKLRAFGEVFLAKPVENLV